MSRSVHIIYANDEDVGDLISAQGIALLVAGSHIRLFPFERRTMALQAMLSRLDQDDTVIVGGGGLLKVSFDRFWGIILEARARRKFRLILWGVGYCDVVGEDTRGALELMREVVRHSEASAFRDDLSYEPFADLPQTRVIGCPALHAVRAMSLHAVSDRVPRRLLRVDHPDLLSGISRRGNFDAEERFRTICQKWADDLGFEIDATTNMIDRVGKVPDSIRARMAVTRVETRVATKRARELVSEHYARADVVVTSRLHGAIIAAALNKRVVALSNDSKIDQFMRSIGLGEYVTGDVAELRRLIDRTEEQPSIEARVDVLLAQNEAFAGHLGLVSQST